MASSRAVREPHGRRVVLRPGPQGAVRGGHLQRPDVRRPAAARASRTCIDAIAAGVRSAFTYAGATHPRGVPRAGGRRPAEHRRVRRRRPAAYLLVSSRYGAAARGARLVPLLVGGPGRRQGQRGGVDAGARSPRGPGARRAPPPTGASRRRPPTTSRLRHRRRTARGPRPAAGSRRAPAPARRAACPTPAHAARCSGRQ